MSADTSTTREEGVTNLELFFDLVFVFAFTQVTSLMGGGHAPRSLLHGMIVLAVLWFAWCSYAWLANQTRADRGVFHAAFVAAMLAVFVACLAIPDVFHEPTDGLSAAATFVACYAVVRVAHVSAYLLAAGTDRALRRRLLITALTSVAPTLALLAVGAWVGEPGQTWIWLVAVTYDFVIIYVGARAGGWALRSVAHFAERHGLVVILALGESIVAIGVGLGHGALSAAGVAGALLAMLVVLGLWWQYFRRRQELIETGLSGTSSEIRPRRAAELFTDLHFPIVAGVILTALGIEQATGHLDEDHLGALGGWALAGGPALMIAAVCAAEAVACGRRSTVPLIGVLVLIITAPLLAGLQPLWAMAVVGGILTALAVAHEARFRRVI